MKTLIASLKDKWFDIPVYYRGVVFVALLMIATMAIPVVFGIIF